MSHMKCQVLFFLKKKKKKKVRMLSAANLLTALSVNTGMIPVYCIDPKILRL